MDSESKEKSCCVLGVSHYSLGEGRWPVSTRSGSKKTEPVFEVRRNALFPCTFFYACYNPSLRMGVLQALWFLNCWQPLMHIT